MIQCCITANAPWPRPPKASANRFVVSIGTRHCCGTCLQIVHTSSSLSLSLHNDETTPFLAFGLTKQVYDEKMTLLQRRLKTWKAGYAHCVLTTWAFVVIVLFVVGYMTPSFWSTGFHDHPFWILLLMTSQLCVFYGLWRYIAYENNRLLQQVENDMHNWHDEYHIRVTMKRVAYILPHPHNNSNNTSSSGRYCFCVSMEGVHDDDATAVHSESSSEESV